MNQNCPNLNDQDMLTDALNTQKLVNDCYNTFATECSSEALKNDVLALLNEEHAIQYDVYEEMHRRGWYPVKSAEQQEIDTLKQKYSGASM